MTIYQLKAKNIANGGYFFDKDVFRMFGDTLKNFSVVKVTFNTVRVTRKRKLKTAGAGSWIFNSITGRMIG